MIKLLLSSALASVGIFRRAAVRAVARFTGEPANWLDDCAAGGRDLFVAGLVQAQISGGGTAAPDQLAFFARLGALLVEDCGPCVRTVLRDARRRGVHDCLLEAAIGGGDTLPQRERDAFLFGQAIAKGAEGLLLASELGERIEQLHGRGVRAELAYASAAVRFFPAIKRGLGLAGACGRLRLKDL